MNQGLEDRFRQACSVYLAAAEQADRDQAAADAADAAAQRSMLAADRARDELLQVVRERDAAGQLGPYGPAGGPVGDGYDDQRRAHYGRTEPVAVRRRIVAGPLDVFLTHYPPAAPGAEDDPHDYDHSIHPEDKDGPD